jgi:hypothetical protein
MKTERRHELQTNTLAVTLARWIELLKPYSRVFLAAIIALVVAVFAWGFLSTQNSRRLADGWNEYFDATMQPDPRERLADIGQQYAGTQVGDWARLALADIQLNVGTNKLLVQKQEGRDELRQAAETYQAVLHDEGGSMLSQRAMFGLARAHETQAAFDKSADALTRAREEYLSIAKQWPDSPYAAAATQRAKDLEQSDTKSFYDWLARYEPPRPLAGEPGTPGARPNFMDDPTKGVEVKLPGLEGDKAGQLRIFGKAAAQKEKEAEEAENKPAESGDGKPADGVAEKPQEPATEKPAEPPTDQPAESAQGTPESK